MSGVFAKVREVDFCNILFFLVFPFAHPQVFHRLAVKFLDLVFKILFLILVLGSNFLMEFKSLEDYR
ncbi:hypothetical protein BMR13_13735 [Escherichia coli]|nr:hypothetical protein BMR13_13735 [Escherichia coli]